MGYGCFPFSITGDWVLCVVVDGTMVRKGLLSANVCSGGKILLDEELDVVIGEVLSWIRENFSFSVSVRGQDVICVNVS